MKKAIQYMLLAAPIGLLWYMKGALVPAVDAKNIMVRGVVLVAAVLAAVSFFADLQLRAEVEKKVSTLWKSFLGKAVAFSYLILGLSTIFAYDTFSAFFGTASRGEGFVGLSFMYFFFFLTAVFFEKKEWFSFWKVTAVSGGILFLKELAEFFGGAYRPGSLMDNPIFLAGYFLIVIYAGLVLWNHGRNTKNKTLIWFGLVTGICAVLGIFITESRGVILGLVVSTLATLGYLFVRGNSVVLFKNYSARKVSGILLISLLAFGGLFMATRTAVFWNSIPGLGRLAQFSTTDLTTQSRIANVELTVKAIAPTAANIKNTLIGWGWDNYVFAWQKHYDPNLYQYDRAIFDRAHNKLLDVLVMNGVLGFIAYIAIWVGIIRGAIGISRKSLFEASFVIFFSVAFFIQNLFVFDTIISYVPFYALAAYMVVKTQETYE